MTRIQHLFGAVSQPEILGFLRTQCVFENEEEIEDVMTKWRTAATKFQSLFTVAQDFPDSVAQEDLPSEYMDKISGVTSDPLFKNSFSMLPYSIRLVEIEKIIAAQRYVNLDYTEKLVPSIPREPGIDFLIDFCLVRRSDAAPPSELQNAANVFSYRSNSTDFRFLGGYPKPLNEDDLRLCIGGGQPVSALILFVGFGTPAVNVFQVGTRLILNNGFHRLYALLSKGIKKAPVIVQQIQNPSIELPQMIAGLPKEYSIQTLRPSIIKDFMNPNLTMELSLKDRERSVQIQWGLNQTDIPK